MLLVKRWITKVEHKSKRKQQIPIMSVQARTVQSGTPPCWAPPSWLPRSHLAPCIESATPPSAFISQHRALERGGCMHRSLVPRWGKARAESRPLPPAPGKSMRLLQLRSVEKRQRQQLLALQRKRAQTPVARNCRKRNASNLRRKRRTSHRPNRRNPHPTHWIRWGLQASFLRTWWYFCARL